MKNKILIASLIGFTLSLSFYSCVIEDGINNPENVGKNFPVIVNTLNTFTFTVDADDFSLTRNETLSFDTDSLTITLVVSSYSAGSGSIVVRNSVNEIFFSDNLNSNKVVTLPAATENTPKSVAITLSNFRGKISFVVTKKK
ncbi:MAG: hypothetical protein FJ213_13375 [Ignavibacteria bacterium]|nr:hypothetical protein [Ignavibacteria bacterium]